MREQSYSRLTVDMTPDQHMCVKMASAKLGLSMKDFMISAALQKIEEIEDEWLFKRAQETLKRIESGEEKVVDLETVKRRLKKKKSFPNRVSL
ncbi:MAG TPA: hypothetical protein VLF61_04750 [Rhabdochlamydiaceae bacterium]|nr:hypothetical protein [Rhabdochlamydiaceae bacterium]